MQPGSEAELHTCSSTMMERPLQQLICEINYDPGAFVGPASWWKRLRLGKVKEMRKQLGIKTRFWSGFQLASCDTVSAFSWIRPALMDRERMEEISASCGHFVEICHGPFVFKSMNMNTILL